MREGTHLVTSTSARPIFSVDHPRVVSNYRAARDIVRRQARGEASTEDLRQALVHYRALFEDLLGREEPGSSSQVMHEDRELVRGHRGSQMTVRRRKKATRQPTSQKRLSINMLNAYQRSKVEKRTVGVTVKRR